MIAAGSKQQHCELESFCLLDDLKSQCCRSCALLSDARWNDQRHMPPFLSHILENHHALASTLFLVVCLEIWNNLPKKPTDQTLKKLLPLIMAKSGFFFVRFISKPSLLKSGSGWKLVATWKFTACVQQRPLHFPCSCMIKELLSPVSHPPLIGNPTSD